MTGLNRAQSETSVTGEQSRENYVLIQEEDGGVSVFLKYSP